MTISLAVDFVGTAQIGQWLAVESEVIKTGSTICFAQSLIKADDAVIARANGTFRVVPKKDATAYPNCQSAVSDHEIDEGAHLGRQQPRGRIDDVDRQRRLLEFRQHDFQPAALDRLRGLIGQHPRQAAALPRHIGSRRRRCWW